MKICNFGSLNLDFVYRVDSFVKPGETKSAKSYSMYAGGKGLNQSIALAKAGAEIYHGSMLGEDGQFLKETLEKYGVDTRYIKSCHEKSGHAVIQVEDGGQNSILLYGGANQAITEEYVDEVLKNFAGEVLLLQNEINEMPYIMRKAKELGCQVYFNAAPMNKKVFDYPLECVDFLIVNEVEGKELAACDKEEEIIPELRKKYPKMSFLLTLGKRGSMVYHKNRFIRCGAHHVPVVDTTGAGDTFIGFFMATYLKRGSIREALEIATTASALAVGKEGASDSIPDMERVRKVIEKKCFGPLKVEEV